ncbi:FixH family protein [Bacillus songklensis]|uniref:FixH family protein n=1 Tax=Bacillus songklensis TaxID=1069116 RepID=A0ABV8B9I9_9BACI
MKKWIAVGAIGLVAVMSGCGQPKAEKEPDVKVVEVQILADEKGKINETMPIEAKVTYGDEVVEDAEVTFELINGNEKERIQAVGQGEGIYHIEKAFKKEGTYEIIAHTNAKGMHTMPRTEIQIGENTAEDVSKPAEQESSAHEQHS